MDHLLPILVLVACCAVGLVLVPLGLPGLWLMVLGVLGYGWLTAFRTVGAGVVGLVVGRALAGGLVGAAVGVPVPVVGSVIGAFAGAFAGAALFEYTRAREAGAALNAGWGAVLGRAAAAAVKLALGIAIAVVGAVAALRG